MKWFCEKSTAAKLAGYYGYTTQGVPEPIGTSGEEKAALAGEKILLKVMLKSLQNRKINYVKGGEVNDLKQNSSALTAKRLICQNTARLITKIGRASCRERV